MPDILDGRLVCLAFIFVQAFQFTIMIWNKATVLDATVGIDVQVYFGLAVLLGMIVLIFLQWRRHRQDESRVAVLTTPPAAAAGDDFSPL
jgi:hypothetical protein